MGGCPCLADMLYPAVISLAGCSSAEPLPFLTAIVNLLKICSVKKKCISAQPKEENAPSKTVSDYIAKYSYLFFNSHNYWRLLIAYSSLRLSFDTDNKIIPLCDKR
jgi:hypothetical protein